MRFGDDDDDDDGDSISSAGSPGAVDSMILAAQCAYGDWDVPPVEHELAAFCLPVMGEAGGVAHRWGTVDGLLFYAQAVQGQGRILSHRLCVTAHGHQEELRSDDEGLCKSIGRVHGRERRAALREREGQDIDARMIQHNALRFARPRSTHTQDEASSPHMSGPAA